jgi:hypothetical protein
MTVMPPVHHDRARRLVSGVALTLTLLGSPWPGAAADPAEAPGPAPDAPAPYVDVEGERLTVEARDADLAEVLGQIAARAGFRLTTMGELGRVTATLTAGSLEEGLRRLVRPHELMLVFGRGEGRLVEVRVFAASPERVRSSQERSPIDPESAAALAEINRLVLARDARDGVARLAELLATASSPHVRARAAWALGRFGGPAAGAALAPALGDPSAEVRIQGVNGLRRVEGAGAIPAIQALLLGDPEAGVRRAAARALGTLSDAQAIAALGAAAADPDLSVRRTVSRALQRHGVPAPE